MSDFTCACGQTMNKQPDDDELIIGWLCPVCYREFEYVKEWDTDAVNDAYVRWLDDMQFQIAVESGYGYE